ncbi:YncE family protein [Bacillus sp. SCS-151]|uniref:YncE family protein n=1 Tax=Nanhaiella sioensis TaxID=3115293 RepID=UPI00397950E7
MVLAYVVSFSFLAPVTVIDTKTHSIIANIPVQQNGIDKIAITPDGKLAYVTSSITTFQSNVTVIDTKTHSVIASVLAGIQQSDIAITPDGKLVYNIYHELNIRNCVRN